MVDLQDAANVALIVSLGANAWNYLYGPWAKGRAERRELREKLMGEIRSTRAAARVPLMGGYVGRLETWSQSVNRFPRSTRKEVGPFFDLTQAYWDAYLLASKIVKLCIYEAVAARTDLARVPPQNPTGGPPWIVMDPTGSSRTARNNLEDSLIQILTEPLLRGEHVRWSWLKDYQDEFSKQLLLVTQEDTVNKLLDDIEKKAEFERATIERPRRIKAAIAAYPFRHLNPDEG